MTRGGEVVTTAESENFSLPLVAQEQKEAGANDERWI